MQNRFSWNTDGDKDWYAALVSVILHLHLHSNLPTPYPNSRRVNEVGREEKVSIEYLHSHPLLMFCILLVGSCHSPSLQQVKRLAAIEKGGLTKPELPLPARGCCLCAFLIVLHLHMYQSWYNPINNRYTFGSTIQKKKELIPLLMISPMLGA